MIHISNNKSLTYDEWIRLIDALKIREKLESANSILIKPNFAAGSYVDPVKHCVVDLKLLSDVIEYLAKANQHAKIFIAESDSTGNGFAYLKFQHLCVPESLNISEDARSRVECLDLTRDRLTIVEDKRMKFFSSPQRSLCLSETLCHADFIISLCNLKSHSVTGYTGACKNLFGCLPDFDKSHFHPYIHAVIHDLTLVIKPDLSIVDAFYAMEGNGPVHGGDIDLGYRIFSDNPLEADYYGAKSIGLNPSKVTHINLLAKTTRFCEKTVPAQTMAIKRPYLFLRIMNKIGVAIQCGGQSIAGFGHRIHTCYNFLTLFSALLRPVLLRFMSIERLKQIKNRLIK